MFGQKRRNTRTLEAVKEHLSTADVHARAVLADAIAQIELRLSRDREERDRFQSSTETVIDGVRKSVRDSATDVGRVLERVADMCALVAERIEADRLERRALVEAIGRLAGSAELPSEAPSRVLGGSVVGSSEGPADAEISLVEHVEAPAPGEWVRQYPPRSW